MYIMKSFKKYFHFNENFHLILFLMRNSFTAFKTQLIIIRWQVWKLCNFCARVGSHICICICICMYMYIYIYIISIPLSCQTPYRKLQCIKLHTAVEYLNLLATIDVVTSSFLSWNHQQEDSFNCPFHTLT